MSKEKFKKEGMDRRKFMKFGSAAVLGTTLNVPGILSNTGNTLPDAGQQQSGSPQYKPETGMKYRRFGRTNIMVSEIGLGCASLSLSRTLGRFLFEKWRREKGDVVNKLLDLGGNLVTTAPSYHNTQELLGEALKGRRDEFYFAISLEQGSEKEMRDMIDNSLELLQTDHIDFSFSDGFGTHESFGIMKKIQEEGLINFIGMSGHNPRNHEWAIRNGYVDFLMKPYNRLSMIKQGSNDPVGTDRLFALAKERDVGVLAIKTMTGNFIPYWANETHDPEIQEIQNKLRKYGPDNLYQALIRWNLGNPNVTCCAIGMDRVQQVIDNVEAVTTRDQFTSDIQDDIMEQYASIADKDYCRLCAECIPACPKNIPIPDLLRYRLYHNNYKQVSLAKNLYNQLPGGIKASACDSCGKCEDVCPYDLKIINKIFEAHASLDNGASPLSHLLT